MANPFWNPTQRRLRALWRLLIQAGAFYAGSIALGVIVGIGAVVALALRPGGLPPDLGEQISSLLATSPRARLLGSLASLGLMLLAVWLAGLLLDRRPFRAFGFHFSRAWWLDLGFGLALGALLMALIFVAELAAGWVTVTGTFTAGADGTPFLAGFAGALIVFVAVGIYEELWARGYQLRNMAEGLNLPLLGPRGALLAAWVLSSLVFGALHAANPNATLASTLLLVIAGLFLGLPFILTGELAISIGLHITWNLFQGNVFGFPVSGTQAGATVIAIEQGGPSLWTGGAFGPEAGLVGLGAMLIGSGFVWLWVRRRRGRAGLVTDLAVYRPPAPRSMGPRAQSEP
ncbi:MAG: lysostaphin resistance A-like protein [Anaerolineae bacterium]